MSLFKRIKNLWALSQFIPLDSTKPSNVGDHVTQITKPRKMAQIIKRKAKDPVEEIVNG